MKATKEQKERMKKHYKKNRIMILNKKKEYYLNSKGKIEKIRKRYYSVNKNKILEYKKEFYLKNKKKIMNNHRIYVRLRLMTDINFKISTNLRNRIRWALKTNSKLARTINLLGCSVEFLKKYLENKFVDGMSWKNYGKWHIDHIRPCASFDLSKVVEQKNCFNYTNLQPLWAKDNLSKGDKYGK